jgi:hypothetical protein
MSVNFKFEQIGVIRTPYKKALDSKNDANYRWLDVLDSNKEHLLLNIKGIPHEY